MARLLLFDIDLTLIYTRGAGRRSMDAVFSALTGHPEPTKGISFEGRTDHAIFMEAIAIHSLGNGDLDGAYREVTEAYLAQLKTSLGEGGGIVLPGVRELLAELRGRGVPPGLATGNSRRGAELKLAHFGIWDAFAAGGFGEETPVRAEVVKNAIAALAEVIGVDADPADAIVIGDTPLDIEAGRVAGVRTLGVATGNHSVESLIAAGADWAFRDLSETNRVIEILLG